MAILNKIRQRSLFLILIIALALFSFVLGGLIKNGNSLSAKDQNTVGTVNGKEISRTAFLEKVEAAQKRAGASATNSQTMNRIWDQEVRQAVFQTQFDKLGISVQKDKMRDLLKTTYATTPQFLNEAGLFDENKLNEYIINLKETSPQMYQEWLNYEESLSENALEQNYFNLVSSGLTGTVEEGELEYNLEANTVDIKYVKIPFTLIADSTIAVSKSDISSYISKYKKQYEVEATRDIHYVEFKEAPTVEDENNIKKSITDLLKDQEVYNETTKSTETITGFLKTKNNQDFVNSNSDLKFENRFVFKPSLPATISDSIFSLKIGEVYGPYKDNGYFKVTKLVAVKQIPDSAKVRHILIPFVGARTSDSNVTRTDTEAKQLADSIMAVVKSNKSKFPDLVKQFSSDKGSLEKEGRYDWHAYNTMVPEFNDFEFEGKVGDIGVVKTDFGYHVIEIEGQKNKEKAVKVATLARRIEPSQATIDKIFRDASNFEISLEKKDFQELATENKYTVRPVNDIKALDENIPGIGNQRPIVRWAFDEESEVGDIKRFDIPSGYAIVQLTAKQEEGLKSVEEATATAMPAIRKERKIKLIRDRVTAETLEDLAAAENTTILTASAINMKNPTISGAGKEPMVVGAAFGLKEGETSKLIDGDSGVFMIQVTKVTPAVKLENYQSYANQVENKKMNTVYSKLYESLKAVADIEDNRVKTNIQ